MKKKIIHTLVYTYEIPVSLEEHLICLKPRSNSFQELSKFDLQVIPSSNYIFPFLSENGDDIFKVNFTGYTNSLTIKAESDIETKIHPDLYKFKINELFRTIFTNWTYSFICNIFINFCNDIYKEKYKTKEKFFTYCNRRFFSLIV